MKREHQLQFLAEFEHCFSPADTELYGNIHISTIRKVCELVEKMVSLSSAGLAIPSNGIEAAGRVPQGDVTEDAKESPPPTGTMKPGQRCTRCGGVGSFVTGFDLATGSITAPCWKCSGTRALPTEPAKPTTKEKTMSNEIPRRQRLDQNTPAELAIRAAVDAVEALGADVSLTMAVILLGQAREHVADYTTPPPPSRKDRGSEE